MGKGSRKKAERRMAREQEKRSKRTEEKYKPIERPSNNNMQSIADMKKLGIGAMFRQQLTLAWYFEAWYEKIILIILCGLGVWKIAGLVF